MKHILFAFLLVGFFSIASAQYTVQSKYFVYLQTEPAQPFYIKINGQKIDANSSGYLILPQLNNGDYKLFVGFPDNKFPDMTFDFKIDGKDKGYLIKNFGAEGWSLFDLQTMAVQKPLSAEAIARAKEEADKKENERKAQIIARRKQQEEERLKAQQAEEARLLEEQKKEQLTASSAPVKEVTNTDMAANNDVSDFTKVLSQATNDPSLLEKPKPEPEQQAVPVDNNSEEKIVNPASDAGAIGEVIKLSQQQSSEGTRVVYEDKSGGDEEQIEIIIPSKTAKGGNEIKETQSVLEEKPANTETAQTSVETAQPKEVVPANCKKIADEKDFLALRREMAAQENDDNMITVAQKAFSAKCYTTSQVRYLSSMFLSNAGKYNFYEVAYKHVSDPSDFGSLQNELKDVYYQEKFAALIKQ